MVEAKFQIHWVWYQIKDNKISYNLVLFSIRIIFSKGKILSVKLDFSHFFQKINFYLFIVLPRVKIMSRPGVRNFSEMCPKMYGQEYVKKKK